MNRPAVVVLSNVEGTASLFVIVSGLGGARSFQAIGFGDSRDFVKSQFAPALD